jgi:hypothetical protein
MVSSKQTARACSRYSRNIFVFFFLKINGDTVKKRQVFYLSLKRKREVNLAPVKDIKKYIKNAREFPWYRQYPRQAKTFY